MKFKIVNLVLALALIMAVGSVFSDEDSTPPGHDEEHSQGQGHENHNGNGNGHDKHNCSPD